LLAALREELTQPLPPHTRACCRRLLPGGLLLPHALFRKTHFPARKAAIALLKLPAAGLRIIGRCSPAGLCASLAGN